MVKNLPADAEDTGSIPGGGTKIPHEGGRRLPGVEGVWEGGGN